MPELRFDGRTAIVTGAGGNPSLGRAYALVLAERGANVVVNDIGRLPDALGYEGVASAEAVVREIEAAGGRAVADAHSVATPEGAGAIVETAMSAFGKVDILVNNAGICPVVAFDAMSAEDFRQTIEINLMGTVYTCRAAWPHMKAARYGRIVNVSSGSMTGLAWQAAYAAAKGGVFSFTRALASEGAEYGIKANIVAPGALTRMVYAAQGENIFVHRARQAVVAARDRRTDGRLPRARKRAVYRGVPGIDGRTRRALLPRAYRGDRRARHDHRDACRPLARSACRHLGRAVAPRRGGPARLEHQVVSAGRLVGRPLNPGLRFALSKYGKRRGRECVRASSACRIEQRNIGGVEWKPSFESSSIARRSAHVSRGLRAARIGAMRR